MISNPTIDLIYLTLVILGLFILKYLPVPRANVVMVVAILLTTTLLAFVWGDQSIEQKKVMDLWIKYTLVGFIVGGISDLLMNLLVRMFRTPGNTNTNNMVRYFTVTGAINSALFAGLITSLMVINTVVFLRITGLPLTLAAMAVTGFMVGVLWGVVVEAWNTKGARHLMVFYKNTVGGFVENRMWDGASIALAAALTKVIIAH
jgi:hypothetical protein